MDEFLNELYGTSEIISGDDLEKQAAAEFLVKLAEEEGVDLDSLSDDEVAGLLSEIEGEKIASAPEPQDEAQEKLAEADFLGRAMAHAYVNELHEIEKDAAKAQTSVLKEVGRQAKGALGKAKEWAGIGKMQRGLATRGRAAEGSRKAEAVRERLNRSAKAGMPETAVRSKARAIAGRTSKAADKMKAQGTRELVRGAGQLGKRVVLPAAAVGGGAALLSKKGSDAEFEAIAQERAYEMLAEAGYEFDQEKVAEAQIAEALDTRALEMLEASGYPVNWS